MTQNSSFLDSFDKRKMFLNEWIGDKKAIAHIALIHGMGEHSGRYGHFADFFVEKGVNVYAIDLFGHGKTEGKRGHTPKMDDYLWQIDFLLNRVKEKGSPAFLYGHSMGGGLVLNYLFKKEPKLAGVIASAPAVAPAFELPKSKLILGRVGRKILPSLTQKNGLDVNGISKDFDVIRKYKSDPLVHDIISAEVGIGVIEWGQWLQDLENPLPSSPLLVMHGNRDRLTSYSAGKNFVDKIDPKLATFKSWDGLFHELHNEPEQNEVFEYVWDWMKDKL